jgi:hypothetical protein
LLQENNFRAIHHSLQKPFLHSTLYDFLREKATLESPVLGEPGQCVGEVLDRPTIGLPNSTYTKKIWKFNEVRKIVQRYNVKYLIFFPKSFNINGKDDQLFYKLVQEDNIPHWLEKIYGSKDILLFQVKLH